MTLHRRVVAALEAAGVPCALVGAAALAAHGVARSTYDVDLLAVDPRCLDSSAWAGLQQAGVAIEIRRGDAEDPLRGVVRAEQAGERPVDVIVGRARWQERAIQRARRLPNTAPVVRASDLILLKLFAGGVQDEWDIRQVLAVSADASALVAEVDADLADLPPDTAPRWARVRRDLSTTGR